MTATKVYYNNIIKDATITVTNEEAGYPIENIYSNSPHSTYRSTGITEISIVFDFGAATSIGAVTVHNHNIVSGDTTYKWEASTDGVTYSETNDLTLLTRTVKELNSSGTIENVTRRDAYHQETLNYRYFRIRIQKASGSYIEVGEVCIFANAYEFAKNYIWGYQGGNETVYSENMGQYGQVQRRFKFMRWICSAQFQGLSNAQKEIIDQELRNCDYIAWLDWYTGKLYFGSVSVETPTHVFTGNWALSNISFQEAL